MRKLSIIGLLTAVFTAVLFAAGAPVITLSADNARSAVGDTFTVTIDVNGAVPFANWAELLKFDPAQVWLVSQSAGTFKTFIPDSRNLADINASGEVRSGGYGFSDNEGGSGTLGVFRFKRLTETTAAFSAEIKSGQSPFGFIFKTASRKSILPDPIQSLSMMTPVAVKGGPEMEALVTSLDDISPNPCNPAMNIAYKVSATDARNPIRLRVFDANGQLVKVLVDRMQSAGRYNATWNAAGCPSGVYLIKYTCGSYSAMRKGMLLK